MLGAVNLRLKIYFSAGPYFWQMIAQTRKRTPTTIIFYALFLKFEFKKCVPCS